MCIQTEYVSELETKGSFVVFISSEKKILGKFATELDNKNGGFLKRAIEASSIKCNFGESVNLIAPVDGIKYVSIICVGKDPLCQVKIEDLGGKAFAIMPSECEEFSFACDGLESDKCDDIPARLCYGAILKSWKFDKYKSEKNRKKINKITGLSNDVEKSKKVGSKLSNLISGVFLARDTVSEPANVLYPASFAEFISKQLLPLGVKVDVIDEETMRELGMGALLGVAQGSVNKPKLVCMQWKGSEDKPIAFIGKGVMFDSGGLDIKPYPHMEGMKGDMAGAAAVVGLMKAAALNKCPRNIVGVVGLVENMPSGSAQKSGDIVKSMSGKTIEVLNTDAEGRLTLADVLWYTQDKFKPEVMIDLATLTGAIVYCLGDEYAGLFSNCDDLSKKLEIAGCKSGEKLWRLPMNDYYDSTVVSDLADLKNITSPGVKAGSITAAQFLKHFVNDVCWAHLDIAGVEISTRSHNTFDAGATGYGVRLLYQFIEDYTSDACSKETENEPGKQDTSKDSAKPVADKSAAKADAVTKDAKAATQSAAKSDTAPAAADGSAPSAK